MTAATAHEGPARSPAVLLVVALAASAAIIHAAAMATHFREW